MDRERKEAPSKWSLAMRILSERRAILRRLAALNHHRPGRDPRGPGGDSTPTSDVMEAVQETLATEIEFASREVLVGRLEALARADEKIRDGTYGRCDVCGQPIPPARLRAMPEAVRCVPCTAQREQWLSPFYRAA